jgi:hypothetical protein
MISDFKQIQELFEETDQKLTRNVNIYIIGGAVLLYQSLKTATRDTDVILPNKESYSTLLKALTSIGFKRKEPTETYKKMEVNLILEKGDLEDCITLAKRGINWNIILKEIQSQIKHSGEDVWITWVGERLDLMVKRGLNIPIMDQIDKLRDTYFEDDES